MDVTTCWPAPPTDPSQDRTSGNQGNFQLSSLTNFPANLGQNTLGFGGMQQPSFGGIGGNTACTQHVEVLNAEALV